MFKTMKYRTLILSLCTIITLMFVSCEKQKLTMDYVSGDDKDKIWTISFMFTSTRLSKTAESPLPHAAVMCSTHEG